MFINHVMTRIWEPVTKIYNDAYFDALQMTAEELYEKHTVSKMKYFPYTGVTMNYVDTTGCSYRRRDGELSGCSMCDYQSELAGRQGSLLALRQKSPVLYAKVVREAFLNSRGKDASANVIENISGYDSLDWNEIPDELCKDLFEKDLFGDIPFIYNVEARASTITRSRLDAFKQNVAKRKRVSIDFGVEIGNEWLRNNWLNKDIRDQDIYNAVELCHEYGFKAVGNVLLGIPGLTEEQTIQQFADSVQWMDHAGIDRIVIHVLNRKQYTLQGYLYHHLKEDQTLIEMGLAQGEHTGIPWLFTVIRALALIYKLNDKIYEKAIMVKIDEQLNSITNQVSYNSTRNCICNTDYIGQLNELSLSKKYGLLIKLEDQSRTDPCYTHYIDLLQRQKKSGSIQQTLNILGRQIAKNMFQNDWEKYYSEFQVPASL